MKGTTLQFGEEQFYLVRDTEKNFCANYVKLNNNETVTVQTLYRYGKPTVKTMTVKEYNAWRTDCEKMKNQEG